MKHRILLIVLATLCAVASSSGQTIRALGYDTTNGQVVYSGTNTLTFTNAFSFSTNAVSAQVRTNLSLGAAWLTNTNVTNFRTAIGLGTNSYATFGGAAIGTEIVLSTAEEDEGIGFSIRRGTNSDIGLFNLGYLNNVLAMFVPISFEGAGAATTTRTNLSLGLPALTNTSNVTMMRALSGSTNTNHPYSGSVALTNTNVLVFSNGILQSIQ